MTSLMKKLIIKLLTYSSIIMGLQTQMKELQAINLSLQLIDRLQSIQYSTIFIHSHLIVGIKQIIINRFCLIIISLHFQINLTISSSSQMTHLLLTSHLNNKIPIKNLKMKRNQDYYRFIMLPLKEKFLLIKCQKKDLRYLLEKECALNHCR